MKALIVIVIAASLTGCISVNKSDYKYGAVAGIAAYQGYNRLTENMSTNNPVKVELVNCVSNLWVAFDSTTNVTDMVALRDTLKGASDKLYEVVTQKLSKDEYRKGIVVAQMYKLYRNQLDKLVDISEDKRHEAAKWLLAFREGIRLMYAIDTGELYGVDYMTRVYSKQEDGEIIYISKGFDALIDE